MSMNETTIKDKGSLLMAQVGELLEQVEYSYRQGEAVHELERGLFAQLLRLGHQLLEMFFELHGDGDQGEQLELNDGRVVKRLEPIHSRAYQSVFGCHRLERRVYGSRVGQNIVSSSHSLTLRSRVSKFTPMRCSVLP